MDAHVIFSVLHVVLGMLFAFLELGSWGSESVELLDSLSPLVLWSGLGKGGPDSRMNQATTIF